MSDNYRKQIERIEGIAMAFEVYEFNRKVYGATLNAGHLPPPANTTLH